MSVIVIVIVIVKVIVCYCYCYCLLLLLLLSAIEGQDCLLFGGGWARLLLWFQAGCKGYIRKLRKTFFVIRKCKGKVKPETALVLLLLSKRKPVVRVYFRKLPTIVSVAGWSVSVSASDCQFQLQIVSCRMISVSCKLPIMVVIWLISPVSNRYCD